MTKDLPIDERTCPTCDKPYDGQFHHMFCRIAANKQLYPDAMDAQGSFLTLAMLMEYASNGESAQLQWDGVQIKTHPYQKKITNQNVLHLTEEMDGFGLAKAFWDSVKWVTDENFDPMIVEINGTVRIINLSCDARVFGQWIAKEKNGE